MFGLDSENQMSDKATANQVKEKIGSLESVLDVNTTLCENIDVLGSPIMAATLEYMDQTISALGTAIGLFPQTKVVFAPFYQQVAGYLSESLSAVAAISKIIQKADLDEKLGVVSRYLELPAENRQKVGIQQDRYDVFVQCLTNLRTAIIGINVSLDSFNVGIDKEIYIKKTAEFRQYIEKNIYPIKN
ncbi:MAG: hypothetical protein HGA85_07045 [Nanoarchaeota archaeon]|nr:hypothetical protein [Nanoarchaeota archaeon]